jgi:hypothetical protein
MAAKFLATVNMPLHAALSFDTASILAAFLLATALPSICILKTWKDFNRMMSQIRYCVAQ